MSQEVSSEYTPLTLHRRYQIEIGEAQRLITSFGSDRMELDRLLGACRNPQIQKPDGWAAAA
ncbi:MAG: hypothetical protein KGI75_30730 [Rhizobiaceae bacterium]|nr:hypothetical protein [Rhizobiaceae bacterium]